MPKPSNPRNPNTPGKPGTPAGNTDSIPFIDPNLVHHAKQNLDAHRHAITQKFMRMEQLGRQGQQAHGGGPTHS